MAPSFTPTKDYSPKRQFFHYSFSIHYCVKFKKLTTFKTVSRETPTQHSFMTSSESFSADEGAIKPTPETLRKSFSFNPF